MDPFSTAITIATAPWRWGNDLLHAGALRMRLQSERALYKDLKELRDRHLQSLYNGSPSPLLEIKLNSIQLAIDGDEPAISTNFLFFNMSILALNLGRVVFSARFEGDQLSLAPTWENPLDVMHGNQIYSLTFRQPVQSGTRARIVEAIEKHNRVTWTFSLSLNYTIQEIEKQARFSRSDLIHREIPFRP